MEEDKSHSLNDMHKVTQLMTFRASVIHTTCLLFYCLLNAVFFYTSMSLA